MSEGRIGQPWREACERRAENRHRALLNVILGVVSGMGDGKKRKKWKPLESVGVSFLRPLSLTPKEANDEDARLRSEIEAEAARAASRKQNEETLRKLTGG